VPLVESSQSCPVGSSDRLDAGAHGWNIADCHTLLGPEETAAPVLFHEGPAVVFFSAGSLSDRIPGPCRIVWCVSAGWVVSRWVFEI
jgi:hypothetical protein